MDGWADIWMDAKTDGWIAEGTVDDTWMDEWMDG